ncbi:hypothetical protein HK097_009803 [Rhizophlyctis rosea]|uniref:Uncharacterized protein n=1 Tax=Rhizophlyctis rosea TaxID=64517 RepID=A0AAD5S9Z8_9FUNG|nr:hypothetical protein HK097_009803 [Rhizophlyctis rosea]
MRRTHTRVARPAILAFLLALILGTSYVTAFPVTPSSPLHRLQKRAVCAEGVDDGNNCTDCKTDTTAFATDECQQHCIEAANSADCASTVPICTADSAPAGCFDCTKDTTTQALTLCENTCVFDNGASTSTPVCTAQPICQSLNPVPTSGCYDCSVAGNYKEARCQAFWTDPGTTATQPTICVAGSTYGCFDCTAAGNTGLDTCTTFCTSNNVASTCTASPPAPACTGSNDPAGCVDCKNTPGNFDLAVCQQHCIDSANTASCASIIPICKVGAAPVDCFDCTKDADTQALPICQSTCTFSSGVSTSDPACTVQPACTATESDKVGCTDCTVANNWILPVCQAFCATASNSALCFQQQREICVLGSNAAGCFDCTGSGQTSNTQCKAFCSSTTFGSGGNVGTGSNACTTQPICEDVSQNTGCYSCADLTNYVTDRCQAYWTRSNPAPTGTPPTICVGGSAAGCFDCTTSSNKGLLTCGAKCTQVSLGTGSGTTGDTCTPPPICTTSDKTGCTDCTVSGGYSLPVCQTFCADPNNSALCLRREICLDQSKPGCYDCPANANDGSCLAYCTNASLGLANGGAATGTNTCVAQGICQGGVTTNCVDCSTPTNYITPRCQTFWTTPANAANAPEICVTGSAYGCFDCNAPDGGLRQIATCLAECSPASKCIASPPPPACTTADKTGCTDCLVESNYRSAVCQTFCADPTKSAFCLRRDICVAGSTVGCFDCVADNTDNTCTAFCSEVSLNSGSGSSGATCTAGPPACTGANTDPVGCVNCKTASNFLYPVCQTFCANPTNAANANICLHRDICVGSSTAGCFDCTAAGNANDAQCLAFCTGPGYTGTNTCTAQPICQASGAQTGCYDCSVLGGNYETDRCQTYWTTGSPANPPPICVEGTAYGCFDCTLGSGLKNLATCTAFCTSSNVASTCTASPPQPACTAVNTPAGCLDCSVAANFLQPVCQTLCTDATAAANQNLCLRRNICVANSGAGCFDCKDSANANDATCKAFCTSGTFGSGSGAGTGTNACAAQPICQQISASPGSGCYDCTNPTNYITSRCQTYWTTPNVPGTPPSICNSGSSAGCFDCTLAGSSGLGTCKAYCNADTFQTGTANAGTGSVACTPSPVCTSAGQTGCTDCTTASNYLLGVCQTFCATASNSARCFQQQREICAGGSPAAGCFDCTAAANANDAQCKAFCTSATFGSGSGAGTGSNPCAAQPICQALTPVGVSGCYDCSLTGNYREQRCQTYWTTGSPANPPAICDVDTPSNCFDCTAAGNTGLTTCTTKCTGASLGGSGNTGVTCIKPACTNALSSGCTDCKVTANSNNAATGCQKYCSSSPDAGTCPTICITNSAYGCYDCTEGGSNIKALTTCQAYCVPGVTCIQSPPRPVCTAPNTPAGCANCDDAADYQLAVCQAYCVDNSADCYQDQREVCVSGSTAGCYDCTSQANQGTNVCKAYCTSASVTGGSGTVTCTAPPAPPAEETTASIIEEETTVSGGAEQTTAPIVEEGTTAPGGAEQTTAPIIEEETTAPGGAEQTVPGGAEQTTAPNLGGEQTTAPGAEETGATVPGGGGPGGEKSSYTVPPEVTATITSRAEETQFPGGGETQLPGGGETQFPGGGESQPPIAEQTSAAGQEDEDDDDDEWELPIPQPIVTVTGPSAVQACDGLTGSASLGGVSAPFSIVSESYTWTGPAPYSSYLKADAATGALAIPKEAFNSVTTGSITVDLTVTVRTTLRNTITGTRGTRTATAQYSVTVAAGGDPSILVNEGAKELTYIVPSAVTLQGTTVFSSCGQPANATYAWTVSTVNAAGKTAFSLSGVTTNTTTLSLASGSLPWVNANTYYEATLTATFVAPYAGVVKTATIVLRPQLPRIIAEIVGGDRVTGRAIDILIDGSKSRDPAFPNAALTYAWVCAANDANNQATPCPAIQAGVSQFTLLGANLVDRATYNFTLTVTNAQTGHVQLTTETNGVAVPVTRNVGFNVTCAGGSAYTYDWTAGKVATAAAAATPLAVDSTTIAAGGKNLTAIAFRSNLLAYGTSYWFNATVTSGGKTVTASYKVLTMTAPYAGSLKVSLVSNPTTDIGSAFEGLFSFQATGWRSDYSPSLTYAFTAIVGNTRYPLVGESVVSSPTAYIPVVAERGTIEVVVYDQYRQNATVTASFTTTDPYASLQPAEILAKAQTNANTQLQAALTSGNPANTLLAVANAAGLLERGGGNGATASPEVQALKAQLITALVGTFNAAGLNVGQASTLASTILSVNLNNADRSTQTKGLGALSGSFRAIGGGVGTTVSPAVRTSAVNQLASMLKNRRRARRRLLKRQTEDFDQILIDTYHAIGEATNNGMVCDAAVQIDGDADATIASAVISAYGGKAVDLGVYSAAVTAPQNTNIDLATIQPGEGCVRVSIFISNEEIHDATAALNYTTPVISLNINAPSGVDLSGKKFDFYVQETQTPPAGTEPVVRRYTGSSWVETGCTYIGQSNGILHGQCDWSPARAARRLWKRADEPLSGQVVFARQAVTPTEPEPTTPSEGTGEDKLGGGAIAGIVVGSVAGSCLIAAAVFYFVKKR